MNRRIRWCSVLLGSVLASACQHASHATPESGSITGRVKDEQTGAPLGGVLVAAKPLSGWSGGNRQHSAVTSTEGAFSIRDLAPGFYELEAERAGLVLGKDSALHRRTRIQDHTQIRGITIQLRPGVVLMGTVRSTSGTPAAGVSVEALKIADVSGVTQFVPAGQTISDETGRYAISVLPAASYLLFARPRYHTESVEPIDAGTFYPDCLDPYKATAVTAGGEPLTARNIKLRHVVPGRVRVKLKDYARDTGANAPGAIIGMNLRGVAFNRDSARRFPPIPFGQDAVEFQNLPPGRYIVYAVIPATNRFAYLPANLSAGQEIEETLTLVGGVEINGRVSGRPAAELASAWVGLTPIDLPALSRLSARVEANGSFSLHRVMPGHFAVAVSDIPRDVVLRSISWNDRVNRGAEIEIQANGRLLIEGDKRTVNTHIPVTHSAPPE